MTPGIVVAVLVAGAIGALVRYGASLLLLRFATFPRAVLLVNVLGSVIGGAALAFADFHLVSPAVHLILLTGLAGGLTTFSTWSVETIQLVMAGRWRTALASVIANLVLGIAAATAAYSVIYFFALGHQYRP